MVELVLNKGLINSIPSVIGDRIMNQYWSGIYFDNIELLKNTEYILDKILMFIIKHIINDYDRLFVKFGPTAVVDKCLANRGYAILSREGYGGG